MTPEEIIEYFRNKELPATLESKGGKINNCKTFVETQVHRIKNGAPLIQRVSFDHLVRFKEELEK